MNKPNDRITRLSVGFETGTKNRTTELPVIRRLPTESTPPKGGNPSVRFFKPRSSGWGGGLKHSPPHHTTPPPLPLRDARDRRQKQHE